MAKHLVLLDFRLTGMVSNDVGEVMQVSVRTPIREALEKVAAHARKVGGLGSLLICCHGIERQIDDFSSAVPTRSLGFGLELASENLTLSNVGVTAVLRGPPPLVKRIVVFACGPSRTHATQRGKFGDGMRLMGEIALTTGAHVVASSETQIYHLIPSLAQFLFNADSDNDRRIDFGDWEGDVFEFSPDDGMHRKLWHAEQPTFDF